LALATIEATTIRFAIFVCHVPFSKIKLNEGQHGRFRDSDILRHVFEAVVRACMDALLLRRAQRFF
jgi:hypothetical protein